MNDYFASCGSRLEDLLANELQGLRIDARATRGGVRWQGEPVSGQTAVLWSRLASRVYDVMLDVEIDDADSVYRAGMRIDWSTQLRAGCRYSIEVSGAAKGIRHTLFAAQRLRDAVQDRLRDGGVSASPVPLDQAEVMVALLLRGGRAFIGIDLGHGALHQRGYRVDAGPAPLRETLAAAMLWRAGWPALAEEGAALVDPFCGGATLLIEAAWMAADVAPGLRRSERCPLAWSGWSARNWQGLCEEAQTRAREGLRGLRSGIFGFDNDPVAIAAARRNLQNAGLAGHVRLHKGEASRFDPAALGLSADPARPTPGLIVANLPYGERLGEERALLPVHRAFGARLGEVAVGWRYALLTGGQTLSRATGLRAERVLDWRNGPIDCQLMLGMVQPQQAQLDRPQAAATPHFQKPGTEMVYNRLRKNLAHFGRWARKQGLSCYRLYDADLPEYSAAIDIYGDRAHVQEYAPPKTIPVETATERLADLVHAVQRALQFPPEHIYLKRRERRREGSQYERQDDSAEFFQVSEGGLQFWVNLADYLDTGLFLDSRDLRARLREQARDCRVLNLFCYTGTASVYATAGGASRSLSIDLSPTYVAWAERNYELNRVDPARHKLMQADVMGWLRQRPRQHFDLAYVDPPTFSNSKRTDTVFDVQRDHLELLQLTGEHLSQHGRILFVCNRERFTLDPQLAEEWEVEALGKQSIPTDFARHPRIHHAFWLRKPPRAQA
jgi:23S rRNA (guanine2445-N2)-methyltransferase / 23S rRNA (guanine2069-N7)-methyltransferase